MVPSCSSAVAPGQPGDPDRLARHHRGIGEEGERTRHERGVEDVHARTAENLLAEYDGEGGRKGHHPQRNIHRHDHRDQQTRHQKALVDLMAAHLRESEFDTEAHRIGDHDDRQHLEEAEPERSPEFGRHALREEVLVARIVESEQQRRQQRHDHHDHRTLHVVGVADVRAAGRRRVRNEKERLERIERRFEEAQLAPFGEGGLDLVHKFTQSHRYASLIIKLIPSRMICWIPIFEGSTNSQSAKSSSVTS